MTGAGAQTSDGKSAFIELVLFNNDDQQPLTKSYRRDLEGNVKPIPSAHMARGSAKRIRLPVDNWTKPFKTLIEGMPSHQAIALGTLVSTNIDEVAVTTKDRLSPSGNGTTAM